MKTNSKKSTENWINSLYQIKNELDNKNCKYLNSVVRTKKINHSWHGFLRSNNIIYKTNGFYKWNDKIPISNKLINKFREYQKQNNYQRKQVSNLFNMPQTPLPKPPKIRKTRTTKVEVQVNDKSKSELGVIRRFLKWLW